MTRAIWAPSEWELRPGRRLRAAVYRDPDVEQGYHWRIEAYGAPYEDAYIDEGTCPTLEDACAAAEKSLRETCGVEVRL